MPIKTRKFVTALTSKLGFERIESRGRGKSLDHHNFKCTFEGIGLIFTKLSHSRREIDDRLLARISRQMRVRRAFLVEVVECTKSREEYKESIRTDPHPPWSQRII